MVKETRQHRVKISTTGVGKLYNLASLELEDEIQAISVLSHHWHEVGYDTNRKFSQELEGTDTMALPRFDDHVFCNFSNNQVSGGNAADANGMMPPMEQASSN